MTPWLWLALVVAVLAVAIGTIILLRRMGARRLPDTLRPGRPLPSFSAITEDGTEVRSDELRGAPAVVLFVRGNWCPFCSRQVASLTQSYRRINELGARLVLVTPKPLETTRRVAEFFDFEFEFWLDENLAAAHELGLVLKGGVPESHRPEYGRDTLWPAALVTDAGGIIRDATISKMIADRPSPARFVRALERMTRRQDG